MAETTTRAAFFRVEGLLSARTSWAAATWMSVQAQRLRSRMFAPLGVALAAPFAAGPLRDEVLATRLAFMGLRGMSEDRLVELGREYAETFLIGRVPPVCVELLREARRRGERVVLVSDNLDVVVAPLARTLGVEDLLSNRLELGQGRVTGRLAEPVITSTLASEWVRRWSSERAISLEASAAYATSEADALFLRVAGKPCAVRPDRALRRMARDLDWPVVDR